MKIKLSRNPEIRADQLKILRLAMYKRAKQIKRERPNYKGKVFLQYSGDFVEIQPNNTSMYDIAKHIFYDPTNGTPLSRGTGESRPTDRPTDV